MRQLTVTQGNYLARNLTFLVLKLHIDIKMFIKGAV